MHERKTCEHVSDLPLIHLDVGIRESSYDLPNFIFCKVSSCASVETSKRFTKATPSQPALNPNPHSAKYRIPAPSSFRIQCKNSGKHINNPSWISRRGVFPPRPSAPRRPSPRLLPAVTSPDARSPPGQVSGPQTASPPSPHRAPLHHSPGGHGRRGRSHDNQKCLVLLHVSHYLRWVYLFDPCFCPI